MNQTLLTFLADIEPESRLIGKERQQVLQPLIEFIVDRQKANEVTQLNFICTHNARRSHMAQLWCAAAARYYNLDNIETFSGGVEVTEFHPNALASMERAGFEFGGNETGANPIYFTQLGDALMLELFSKRFDDESNPQSDFAAVMVCSDAETKCPFVPGATKRISVTYQDPKVGDGTPEVNHVYDERTRQIASEMMFVMRSVDALIGA